MSRPIWPPSKQTYTAVLGAPTYALKRMNVRRSVYEYLGPYSRSKPTSNNPQAEERGSTRLLKWIVNADPGEVIQQ